MSYIKLRDEFAKAAIAGILAGKWGQMPHRKAEEAFAEFAYTIAEAMLQVRAKRILEDGRQEKSS